MTYNIISVDTGWTGERDGDFQLRDHFSVEEFACNDGSSEIKVCTELLDKLEELRVLVGVPFKLNSAYRTASYNASIGGVSNSQHVQGRAVDLAYTDAIAAKFSMDELKHVCIGIGFKGIGTYSNFIHLDCRENPNDRGWSEWNNRT